MIIILFVIVFLLLGSWSLVSLFRRLQRQASGFGWWFAFGLIILCGAALGSWCAIYSEYNLGPHFQIGGFPFPIVFVNWKMASGRIFPFRRFSSG